MTLPPLPGTFGSLTYVQMISDAQTPPEYMVMNNVIVGFRQSDPALAEMGSGPDNPGELMGVHGYPVTGGPTGQQFLMTPPIPQSIVDGFQAIPHPNGWAVPEARQVWADYGLALINTYNVAPGTVLAAWQAMYNAARDELVYRHTNGLPLMGEAT